MIIKVKKLEMRIIKVGCKKFFIILGIILLIYFLIYCIRKIIIKIGIIEEL